MDYVRLGNTELTVSRLCFGGLTVGPLQANLTLEDGAKVIAEAFDKGVNFIDTAKLYKTYPYIKKALEISNNKNIVIASKSYDYTYEGMKESLEEALEELGLKSIGIFSLHEQESKLTLKGHEEALRFLIEAKKSGLIKAVGVSTHAVEVVNAIAQMPEIDVVHPIVNIKGLGIMDGTISDMLRAVERAYKAGKGIYAMKPLGGGNLMNSADECFDFVLKNKYIHSIAVGMQTKDEVVANVNRFEGVQIDNELLQKLINRKKNLHIDEWCQGCGKCVGVCKSKALKLENSKAVVSGEKCVLCGYCSAHCPDFCIKIV
jgi:uncharacterized protein